DERQVDAVLDVAVEHVGAIDDAGGHRVPQSRRRGGAARRDADPDPALGDALDVLCPATHDVAGQEVLRREEAVEQDPGLGGGARDQRRQQQCDDKTFGEHFSFLLVIFDDRTPGAGHVRAAAANLFSYARLPWPRESSGTCSAGTTGRERSCHYAARYRHTCIEGYRGLGAQRGESTAAGLCVAGRSVSSGLSREAISSAAACRLARFWRVNSVRP